MDLIIVNANIITMDSKLPQANALGVKDGKFIAVGTNAELLKLKTDNSELIDLEGKTITPGFNESHLHLLYAGNNLKKVDLTGSGSIQEVIDRTKCYIDKYKPAYGEWILGVGWNQLLFAENRSLTRHDLDQISTDHPICFTRVCVHSIVANSKAMALAGITKNTPQPKGGFFEIAEDGEPIGAFSETARYLIYDAIPDPGVADMKKMIMDAAMIASSNGVTSVQSDDFEAMPSKNWRNVLKAYKELLEEGGLPVRVYQQCLLPDIERLQDFLDAGYKTGHGDEFFKIGPLKLLTDGSLGARTAYLDEPYTDDPSTRGVPVFTQEELDQLSIAAHKGGMQLVYHAIGDAAVDMCLNSFISAQEAEEHTDPRFGIIHIQITKENQFDKFRKQNVIAYIEPICMNCDLHMAEDRVGTQRIKTSYNYKSFFDYGVPTAMSSDWPVDSVNPMKNIYVATTRKDYTGCPEEGWMVDQCLTIEQALYAFTMGSAYASFDEKLKGSIEVGKYADFVVLSDDLYSASPEALIDISAEKTFMNGKLVYSINKSR